MGPDRAADQRLQGSSSWCRGVSWAERGARRGHQMLARPLNSLGNRRALRETAQAGGPRVGRHPVGDVRHVELGCRRHCRARACPACGTSLVRREGRFPREGSNMVSGFAMATRIAMRGAAQAQGRGGLVRAATPGQRGSSPPYLHSRAASHVQSLAGDEPRVVRCEEHRRQGDVIGLAGARVNEKAAAPWRPPLRLVDQAARPRAPSSPDVGRSTASALAQCVYSVPS
ncbi:MAG: hypothetical protein JWP29_371 [Rhodoferax sp.]|nr:hypothetical protein [Rhodoferax sp.]